MTQRGPRMATDATAHWNDVWGRKRPTEVSWFQERPATSLELIARAGPGLDELVVDVGGGASSLVDHLLDRGHRRLLVLDLAAPALDAARLRLGDRAAFVTWLVADVTRWEPAAASVRLWHDRAVFHFLVEAEARAAYLGVLRRAVAPRGDVVLGTFAPDGPERCSGLPVQRHDAASLSRELGGGFSLADQRCEDHPTPSGAVQRFQWCRFRREG